MNANAVNQLSAQSKHSGAFAQLPKALFKYVTAKRGLGIIKNLQIRFTQPSSLNDPFEFLPCIDWSVTSEQIHEAANKVERTMYRTYVLNQSLNGAAPVAFEKFHEVQSRHNHQRIEELKNPQCLREKASAWNQKWWDKVGILSLSAAEKSLLMWGHYTSSHEGMLIEFDPKHPFFSPPGKIAGIDFGILTEVVYSTTRPRRDFRDGANALPSLKTKSEHWAHELEWRVFQLLENSHVKGVPGDATVHLFKVPPESILRVVVGYRMSKENRAKLIDVLRENSNLGHVRVYEAKLDNDKFDLIYSPLSSAVPA